MATTSLQWWTELMDLMEPGGRTSDPTYYSDAKAQEGEWANIITTGFQRFAAGSPERAAFVDKLSEIGFWEATDDLNYWKGTGKYAGMEPDPADIGNLGTAAEERLPGTDWNKYSDPNYVAPRGATRDGAAAGIMEGGTIHKVSNPGQPDYYVIAYEFPAGSGHSFYYRTSEATLSQALGPGMGGGSYPIGAPIQETQLDAWTDAGDPNEVVGIPGTFNQYVDDITRKAAIDAGINDPGLLGRAMADKDMQLLLAKIAASDTEWTEDRVKAEMRNVPFYYNELHPGINNFYNTANPEAEYAMFKQNIEASLKSLGTPREEYGSKIKELADAGVSDIAFATFVPTYKKASTNADYAADLNKWTTAITGKSISTFEDWYDVLAGNSPQEISDIAEMAGLQYAADLQNFSITDEDLQTIGQGLDLDENAAGQLFSNTARRLIALGETGLRRGGLTTQQVLMAEAGIGDNTEGIKQKMQKLAAEQGLADDETASWYTAYNQQGAPVKSGLGSTVIEGA